MSHHYSGPDFGFPWGDARLDLTDIYAFSNPGDPTKSILIMNVHPSSTVIRPEPTTTEPFAPHGLYEIAIDTNGDAIADIAYRMKASRAPGGGQHATLIRAEGEQARTISDAGAIVLQDAPVSIGAETHIAQSGSVRFFAGWRSEPFFFDTLGALNNLKFTGSDFFTDKNVCSIVLEVPNTALGSGPIGLWARVLAEVDGAWVSAERGARPQQAVFLSGEARDAYHAASPADDAQFVPVFAHSLEHAGGYTPAEAARVAATLLPDILRYDPSRPASYPENGRTLTDDAADTFLAVLTNGKITGDGVGPHHDLLNEFPFVAPPHGP